MAPEVVATPQEVLPDDWANEEMRGTLNEALATELVCVLRYKRHHYMAKGIHSPRRREVTTAGPTGVHTAGHAVVAGVRTASADDRATERKTLWQ